MATHVALLRGINLGGRNKVSMPDLRDIMSSLGHTDVATYIQSGNVVFRCALRSAAKVEAALGKALQRDAGLDVVVLVRTPAQLAALVDGEVDDREAEAISRIYRDLSGVELTAPEIYREATMARQAGTSAPEYAGRFTGTLNEQGKEMVLRSVMLVLGADGRSDDAAGRLVLDLGKALNISGAHFRGIVAEMSEPSGRIS